MVRGATLSSTGRRKRGSSATSGTWSQADCSAWSNRPYGCHSLIEARRLYKEKQEYEAAPENSWLRIPKHKPLSAYPVKCYSHEHPLKTGRKGVLYFRHDFVTPIIDSMRDMQESNTDDVFGLVSYIANKKRKVSFVDKPLNSKEKPSRTAPVHSWTCKGCGSHDHGKLVLGHEGYTCPCGVWAGNQIVGANRQKLGAAEDEDKTITADKPWQSKTDKYDRGPETAKEARASRLAAARTGGGLNGQRAGMHMGRLCDVQAICEREAAKNIVEAEVAAGISLMPRDRVKQRAVLAAIENMFTLLHPVDHGVKRAVRMAADKTYIAAVQHCLRCERRDVCEIRLADRHATAIAQSMFENTIDKLCENEGDRDERIDLVRLNELRSRMHRSVAFHAHTSATQLASSKLMIDLINSPDFDVCKQCEPCETDMPVMPSNLMVTAQPLVATLKGIKKPAALRALVSPCLQRSLSICSNGENSPTPSKQIEWRNAIAAIFVAHRTELQTCVRDSALRVIQVPDFLKACESEQKLRLLSDNQLAFCLLNAVALEQENADGTSLTNSVRPNAGIAEKIELGLLVADEAIICMRAAMPADAASDQSERNADDLFS